MSDRPNRPGGANGDEPERPPGSERPSGDGAGEERAGRVLGRGIGRRVERQVENTVSRQGAAYQGAFEAVFAILIAIGLGYWVDRRLDSAPIGMFTGVVLGFAAFVLRLVRLRSLIEGPEASGGEDRAPDARADRAPATKADPTTDGTEGP